MAVCPLRTYIRYLHTVLCTLLDFSSLAQTFPVHTRCPAAYFLNPSCFLMPPIYLADSWYCLRIHTRSYPGSDTQDTGTAWASFVILRHRRLYGIPLKSELRHIYNEDLIESRALPYGVYRSSSAVGFDRVRSFSSDRTQSVIQGKSSFG